MKKLKQKLKVILFGALIASSTIFSVGYVDSYFEISKNLDIFATLFKELNIYYVDETKPGELMKTGIDAMLKSLDPYTNFYPESDIEDYRFMTTGEYGGIGSMIRKKDSLIIVAEPYEGFPAEKAGLWAGDVIEKIDGKDISGYKTDEVSKLLKGAAKTKLTLSIYRPVQEKRFDADLTREDVKIKDVPYFGMLENNTGYIKLTGFTQTASKELKDAYKSLKEEGMETMILDLRGNGGGLLNEAVNIVNFFVDKGQEVVSTKGKVKQWDRVHKALNEPLDKEIPLTILIDEMSASASEIVSGALQDLDRAVVIGRKSFGKGLVQQTRSLSYNSKLKVTVAKYYIPSGRCIQKLDYSHKDEKGKAGEIPDSLKSEFKTSNGRIVFDGGGIEPDVKVDEENFANITFSLLNKQLIFDYASEFRAKKDSIKKPYEFEFTDEDYMAFKEFIKDKEYDYTTQTEKLLNDLKEAAEKEKVHTNFHDEFNALEEELKQNKAGDVAKFKDEISRIIENEIISRYYYQSGRIESELKYDKDIAKALELLKNKDQFESILAGTFAKKD